MRLRALYGNLQIKNKVFVLVLLITLLLSSFGFIAFHTAANVYEAKLYEEAAEVLNVTSTIVDNELKKIEDLSFAIMTDNLIQQHLRKVKQQEPGYELYQQRTELLDRLFVQVQEQPYIASIRLIDASGFDMIAGYNPRVKESTELLWERARAARGANVWLPGAQGDDLLTSVRLVRNKQNLKLDDLGLLVIYVNMRTLVDRFLDLSENKQFYVYKDGALLHATRGETLGRVDAAFRGPEGHRILSVDGRKQFAAYRRSNYDSFLYVNMLDYDSVFRQTEAIRGGMIVFYAAMFLLFLVIAGRAARGITRPLELLIQKMKQVQRGEFELPDSAEDRALSRDETGQIHRNFRIMIEKINELISENYAKQLVIKETEYRALQAQINPHFLYNTLETVNWLAKINKQPDISRLVESLGRLLRGIIGRKEATVRLAEELDIVSHYVTIQRYRFGDRLEFRLDYDASLADCLVPKLTIQPIIENAIVHALEEMDGPCPIEVAVRESGGLMEIVVRDGGPGITEAAIAAIRDGSVKPKGTGIGLANIEERLRIQYGEAGRVEIRPRSGGGTQVTVSLPCRKEEFDV